MSISLSFLVLFIVFALSAIIQGIKLQDNSNWKNKRNSNTKNKVFILIQKIYLKTYLYLLVFSGFSLTGFLLTV